jgi:hypothetical protein
VPGRARASFDDPNLVSCAGLEPVMRLAQSCGLHGIVAERLNVPTDKGSNGSGKVAAVVAGLALGKPLGATVRRNAPAPG